MMRALALACSVVTLAFTGSAFAQNVQVTLNGSTQPASGSYTFNFYQNGCIGDAGAPFQTFSLAWPISLAGDALFWSNGTNCAQVADGGGGGNTIQFTTVTNASGATNFASIDATTLLGSIIGNSTSQCTSGASGLVYICVVSTVNVNGGLTVTQESISWYMSFNYNMNPPPAPGGNCNGPCADPGDSSVLVSWSYDNSSITADHFNIFYRADPNAQPDENNQCVPSQVSGFSGPGLFGLDGGGDPGVCNSCAQNSDCGGNNLCVFDQNSVPYCGLNCGADAGICGTDFTCLSETSVDGSTSGLVCVPTGDTCITPDAGSPPPDAGSVLPGVCGACAQSADCGGNDLCVPDTNGFPYCGVNCFQDAGVCPSNFTCLPETSVDGATSGPVCVPPGNQCYDPGSLCGTCVFNSDCGSSNLCLPSDGGNYCGVDCSDAGQLACPEGTFCSTVMNVAGQTGQQCALPPGTDCYNPNGVADAGLDAGISDGGYPDASIPSFGGWSQATANGQFTTSLRVNGLTNGVCYDFVSQAVAVDGTVGYASPVVAAAPFDSQDWWRLYKLQGGQDNGGWHCQSGGGGLTLASLALLLLLGRILSRRRPVTRGGSGD